MVDRSGSVVLEHILCSPNSKVPWLENVKTHELLAVGCWYIWWQRRELVKGENVSPPKSSAFAINALAANFGAVKHSAVEREVKWSKPPRGHQKLNVDASYHLDGSGSAGIVLRNDKGEAIAGKICLLNDLMSSAQAEAMALLRGLQFLEQIGCSSAYIESDSLELIQACNGDTEVFSPYTAVLADCFQIASTMDLVIFQHCHREANMVAHNLAKHGYENSTSLVWDDRPPDFIRADVIHDVTLLEIVPNI
jgi:ribonuclease HI